MLPLLTLLLFAPARAQEPAPQQVEEAAAIEMTENAEGDPEAPPEAPAPRQTSARIIYTGGTQGVGGGAYRFESLPKLSSEATSLRGVEAFHGTLRQGDALLRASDGRLESTLALFSDGAADCGAPEPTRAYSSGYDLLLLDEAPGSAEEAALTAALGPGLSWERRVCQSAGGQTGELLGPAGFTRDEAAPMEVVLALRGALAVGEASLGFTLTGAPILESSRTFTRARALLTEHPEALFVDAGSFVDGASSTVDGALSLHRPTGYDMLTRLGPDALAPGERELLAGAAVFIEEAEAHGLSYIATNWQSVDPALALPASRVVEVPSPDGPLRVAFIALLDPALNERVPQLAEDGVTITDPVEAAKAALRELYESDAPPHAVIALSAPDPQLQRALRREVRGLDVLIGDPSFATLRVRTDEVSLRALSPDTKGAPVTVPADGLAMLELRFEDGALRGITVTPQLVTHSAPVDPEVTARITAVRSQVYPALEARLLPAPSDDPAAAYSQEAWTQLVCEALRWHTGADTVLLGELPKVNGVPGPQTELMVVNQLASLDVLELHRVPGSKLQAFLDKAYGIAPAGCGAAPDAGSAKAWGRSIDPDRVYRVLTTQQTLAGSPLEALLDSATSAGPLDPAPSEVLRNEDGAPLTLRTATLEALRALRDDPPSDEDFVVWLREDAPTAMPPQWTLRARQVSLRVDRFAGPEDEVFAEVPETLITSPDSLTLTTASDLALEHSAKNLSWDGRLRHSYTRLTVDESEPQEPADDWRLSTSLTAPAFAFPPGTAFQLRPYGELLYDSEFTPTADEEGVLNPRQSDLSATLGLSAKSWRFVKTLKVGGFTNRDLARLEKQAEFGGRAELALGWSLDSGVKVSALGDLQVFGDTPTDDASDLRARAWGELRVSAPASRNLAISLYAQGLGVYGRVPETATWGRSTNVGASLDFKGVSTSTALGR